MKISSRKFALNGILATMVASGFSVSMSAQAESDTSDVERKTDEKLVVVASRAPKSISEIPATVWYVDNEAIERGNRSGKSLGQILAQEVPSLDISTEGRTNYGQNLRGRPMLVMIDGVSMNSSRAVSRQLDSIDPFNIERIEVLSGATAIYGAGATGGVVNIITKKADSEALQFESFVSGQSGFNSSEDGDFKIAQSVSGGNDKVRGRASVVYGKTQAFYDANGKMVVPDTTQGSSQFNEVLDTMGSLTFDLADSKSVNLLAQYYSNQQSSPYGLNYGPNFANKTHPTVSDGFSSDRQQGTKRVLLNAEYSDTDFIGQQQLLAQLSFRNEDYTFAPYLYSDSRNGDHLRASQQKTQVISFKTALVKDFNQLSVNYGLDGYMDTLESNQVIFDQATSTASGGMVNNTAHTIGRYPGVETSSVAAFAQLGYQITDRWSVEGGYRFQYMHNKVDDFIAANEQVNIAMGSATSADAVKGGSTDYNIGLFNAGTLYKLTDDSQVWANFSQGFDLPDAAKYYGKGKYEDDAANPGHRKLVQAYDIDSARLEGVKTNSYEIGYRIDMNRLSIQTAAYYALSDKSIKTKNYDVIVENKDKRTYGLEASVGYYINDNWSIGANGHLVETEDKDQTTGEWKKVGVGYSSASKVGSWLGYAQDSYSARLQSQTMLDREDDQGGKLNGYTTVDFLTTVQLPVGSVAFSVNNLFNEDYTTVWGQKAQILYRGGERYNYKGRGRTFALNYQVDY
ncbi:TonB-dependent receptor [Vibrio sp. ZSDZ65]|uniref:Ferric aerobactin receptor n=1 Tax=Vibrio qingdaonensis TaxID=2829491 RepID=A0A9X3CP76_9VIBR|nr:TonB-dependent receptor [Vibrio qingdaonensis]MCW8346855.1 TonB-dependent receptor [Vibrio qingdaonensis]